MLGGRRKQGQFRDSDASSLGVCRDAPIEKARIGVEAQRGSGNKGPICISGGGVMRDSERLISAELRASMKAVRGTRVLLSVALSSCLGQSLGTG